MGVRVSLGRVFFALYLCYFFVTCWSLFYSIYSDQFISEYSVDVTAFYSLLFIPPLLTVSSFIPLELKPLEFIYFLFNVYSLFSYWRFNKSEKEDRYFGVKYVILGWVAYSLVLSLIYYFGDNGFEAERMKQGEPYAYSTLPTFLPIYAFFPIFAFVVFKKRNKNKVEAHSKVKDD